MVIENVPEGKLESLLKVLRKFQEKVEYPTRVVIRYDETSEPVKTETKSSS